MKNQEKSKQNKKEEKVNPVPNNWEPVPGIGLVAEEIERRRRAEEREAKLRNKQKE